jgi:hypothetical protein
MLALKGGTLGAEMTLQRTQVVFPSKASHSKVIQSDQKRSPLICRPSYLRCIFKFAAFASSATELGLQRDEPAQRGAPAPHIAERSGICIGIAI